MRTLSGRKALSAEGLLRTARGVFAKLPDAPGHDIALVDHLMSGLALFGLKYPSLLQFDRDSRQETTTRANLKSLYGVERAPSDSRFRERLDALDPSALQPAYKALFAQLQRGKGLEGFAYFDGHYLLSLDGSGYFSSGMTPLDLSLHHTRIRSNASRGARACLVAALTQSPSGNDRKPHSVSPCLRRFTTPTRFDC